MSYVKLNGLNMAIGNTKLGNDTLILNMGSAGNCPSAAMGSCKLGKKCYALKAERLYVGCRPYRDQQEEYWLNHTAEEIAADMVQLVTTKKRRVNGKLQPLYKSINWLRFNEAGDFWGQSCIEKLEVIAQALRKYKIWVYGYSARADLDFSKVYKFSCKGSGHDNGNNGKTIARSKAAINEAVQLMSGGPDDVDVRSIGGEAFAVCKMDCKICDLCKSFNNLNIVFPLH